MDESVLAEALVQIGLRAERRDEGHGRPSPDVVVYVGDTPIVVEVKHRSLVTDDDAQRLAAAPPPIDGVLLVVADRVTAPARRLLSRPGLGYLDLRGHLALRTDQVVVDTDITPVRGRAARQSALSGRAGLEVATALLLRPERTGAVRELARELGRAPSTVSDVLGALRRDGLLDAGGTVEGTDLFWEVAEHWPTQRTGLARMPSPDDVGVVAALRLGLSTAGQEAGWALTDSAAAVAYGAPLAFRSGQVHDFFVPDPAVVRRATTLLGSVAPGSPASATVRVATVPAAAMLRAGRTDDPTEWPLAHPLFVALDLAQDAGRGREVLEAWTPDGGWPRAW